MKICSKCKKEKEAEEFNRSKKYKDGLTAQCKKCKNIKGQEWKKANPEKVKLSLKIYKENNREKYLLNSRKANRKYKETHRDICRERTAEWRSKNTRMKRANHIKNSYNLPIEEYEAMLISQNSSCAICSLPFPKSPYVDHDHITNKVRALLCNSCNCVLGYAKDNISILQNAIKYLERYSCP